MKKVFPNKQLAHVWASQTQSYGRNAKSSMFFDGDTIYSYGRHFPIATIYNNGKTGSAHKYFALINCAGYSVTTSKHKSYVWSALWNRMDSIDVPHPTDLKSSSNEEYLYNRIADELADIFNNRKRVTSVDRLYSKIADLNKYLEFIGEKRRFELDFHTRNIVAHIVRANIKLDKIKIRMREEQHEKERKLRAEKYVNEIPLWESKQNTVRIPSDLFPFDYVRLKDAETVETSSGAEVPLHAAKRLVFALDNGVSLVGKRIGHFTVDEEVNKDGIIKIGCHKINVNQARKALGL